MVKPVTPFCGTDGDLADRLIDGLPVEPEALGGPADQYVVAVLRIAAETPAALPGRPVGPDALLSLRDGVAVVLLPDRDRESTRATIARLRSCLPDDGWVAVAQRSGAEIPAGYREAAYVARLLEAGRRPGGTYRMADVLVEYAATREKVVAERLVAMIGPLRRHPVLRDTLIALIDSDGNRNKAARALFVHRSTLEYRLRRISEITGVDLATARGVQQLALALVADAMAEGE